MSFNSIKTLFLSFVLFASFSVSTFAADFRTNTLGGGFNKFSPVDSISAQSDGKIIVSRQGGIVNRLNGDGTIDTLFSKNFKMNISGRGVLSTAMQPDF